MPDIKLPQTFTNSHFKKFDKSYHDFFATADNFKPKDDKIEISDLRHVYFELSNMCNYASIHPQCPVSMQKKKIILKSSIVKKVIDELGKNNFHGYISFHRYNEPTNDPRLFEFISYAKKFCSRAKVRLLTNGFYLNQTMVDELYESGITILDVSGYGFKEYNRLINLKAKFPYRVFFSVLDNRKSLYEREKINLTKPCFAQTNDLTINCEGKIPLCCLDFKNKHIFGDLNKDSLKKIVNSRFFRRVFSNLSHGKRSLDLCSRCNWSR